jgi:hypothetical protein
MINSRAMPVPLTSSYQRVAGTVPQHTPSRDFADPLGLSASSASVYPAVDSWRPGVKASV